MLVTLAALALSPPSMETPFTYVYPVKTAVITVDRSGLGTQDIYYIRGDVCRHEAHTGDPRQSYTVLLTPDYEYSIHDDRHEVSRVQSPAAILNAMYADLPAAKQAVVRKSVAIHGPDLPYYTEFVISNPRKRMIMGLAATCYDFKMPTDEDAAQRCYWRGIKLDDKELGTTTTSVETDKPLDEVLFVPPADYTMREASPFKELTTIYEQLFMRMQRPNFTLAMLSRYAK